MPSRNSIKTYLENGYYHIYNRGVEKRNIFENEQDYSVFLSYLKTYLIPKDEIGLQKKLATPDLPWKEKDRIIKLLRLNNFNGEIKLLAYCLMPNHFHLLINQDSHDAIDRFIGSLSTRYVMYFNKKYKRVGPLCQSVYKAVLVETDEQLLHLSAYIHRNLFKTKMKHKNLASQGDSLRTLMSQPSSLPEYLGMRKTEWVNTNQILSFFPKSKKGISYENFVIGYKYPEPIINDLILD